ncbi:hypothetical protein KUTeg_001699 [Tegillarca granosa]|uniref:HTH psq-type domain-containing protein n=1 Tax=Tegillarca granosa TaxID=220873 RepID=A0ABQ9FVV3_TEGGR|nr:hypothetical protein KUTeg_001699 [Tegillarca granosa]
MCHCDKRAEVGQVLQQESSTGVTAGKFNRCNSRKSLTAKRHAYDDDNNLKCCRYYDAVKNSPGKDDGFIFDYRMLSHLKHSDDSGLFNNLVSKGLPAGNFEVSKLEFLKNYEILMLKTYQVAMKKVIARNLYAVGMHHSDCRELPIETVHYCSLEPDNPKDKNAIAIYSDSELKHRVAYFRQEDAAKIFSLFNENFVHGKFYMKAKFHINKYSKRKGPMQNCSIEEMKSWSEESMSSAVVEVKGGMSVRKAAKKYSVPKSSLADCVMGKVAEGARWGRRPAFSSNDEKQLIESQTREPRWKTFFCFAGALAKARGITFKHGTPSDIWFRRLKMRQSSFLLRQPEATATSRHDAMTRPRLSKYFAALKEVMEEHAFNQNPHLIWNMDESNLVHCTLQSGNSWNQEVDNFVKTTSIAIGHAQFLRVFAKA